MRVRLFRKMLLYSLTRGPLLISRSTIIVWVELKCVASTIAESLRRNGKIVDQLSSVTRSIASDLFWSTGGHLSAHVSRQMHNRSGWLHPKSYRHNFHLTVAGLFICGAPWTRNAFGISFSFLLIKPDLVDVTKLETGAHVRTSFGYSARVLLSRAPSSERIYDEWRLSIAPRSLFSLEGALIFAAPARSFTTFYAKNIVAVQTLLCTILRKKFRITIAPIFYVILEYNELRMQAIRYKSK